MSVTSVWTLNSLEPAKAAIWSWKHGVSRATLRGRHWLACAVGAARTRANAVTAITAAILKSFDMMHLLGACCGCTSNLGSGETASNARKGGLGCPDGWGRRLERKISSARLRHGGPAPD